MQFCSGTVNVHRHDDACEDGETVQSMAVSPSGAILAVITQLHLQFWSAGPKTVYLTSLLIPDTSLDDDPAMFVIWRPRQGNDLAVVTSHRVVFFEADINLKPGEFMQSVKRQRHVLVLQHTDSASRVCYSCEIRIEAGLTTTASAAGPYAFLVTTTAGVVYVVGWHRQDVLHQWTTVGLQDSSHSFDSCVAAMERENGSLLSRPAAAAALRPASASVGSTAGASFVVSRGSAGSTPAAAAFRVDPLQRRYQQPTAPPDTRGHGCRSEGVSPAPPATTTTASFAAMNAAAAGNIDASPTLAKPEILASNGICPPGVVVRSGEDRSFSISPSPSATLLAAPELVSQQVTNSAQQASGNDGGSGGGGDDDEAVAARLDTTTSLADNKAVKSSSFTASVSGATDGSGGLNSRRTNACELLSGTILHAAFISKWKVLSFVFSSGAVLLCRPSCGTNFTHSEVHLRGCVTPIVSAFMVAPNARHLLLAVCTQAGALSCRRIDGNTLAVSVTPLWKGLRGLQDRFATSPSPSSQSAQSLGLISAMEWSPSEELLCVAFYKHGVVLVHYSGAVVTHHLAGPATATLLRSPGAAGLSAERGDAIHPSAANGGGSNNGNNAAIGCSFVSWKPDGTRLWMAAPDETCFFSTQLSRVLMTDTVGPTSGIHAPVALLADDAVFLVSVSEATERQGVRELVLLPEDYLRDQFPLLYGAVSYDGSWIACAGRRGVLIFNRDRFSWKLASKKQEEMALSCVADPVWLSNIAVAVPALRTDTKAYELVVLSTLSVSPSHALARVALEGKPSMLSCVDQDHRSEGYIVVVDCSQVVHVFRYDTFMDAPSSLRQTFGAVVGPAKTYIAVTPVQQLVLSGDLASPLQVMPVCLYREEDDRGNPQRAKDQAELRLLLHRRGDHALVWIHGATSATAAQASTDTTSQARQPPLASKGDLPQLYAVAEPLVSVERPPAFTYHCWVDRTPPVRGSVLLAHEEESGIVLYQLQRQQLLRDGNNSRGSGAAAGLAVQRMEVTPTRDTELLPLCVSPFDGYVLCCGTDASAPRSARRSALADSVNNPAHPQLVLRPVLYAHRLLSLLLLVAMPGGAAAALRVSQLCLPKSGSSVPATSKTSSCATSALAAPAATPVSAAEMDGRIASFMWDRGLFLWLEQMRLNNTFVAVMDYFLHTALNESPPAAVPGLGRRSAVRATIALLRNYPEFYTIVVGCVRKMDFTRWCLLLDFLGTPTAFFRECVSHHCYAEAVHLVRVIMMGSYKPTARLSAERLAQLSSGGADALTVRSHSGNGGVNSLEQASQCAIELFGLSIENGDYTAAYDLLRFMTLLEDEIGMPTAGSVDREGGGSGDDSSEGFLTRWLRQLTFSGAAYDDPDAAVEETTEAAAADTTSAATAAWPDPKRKLKNQIGNYATLVLDAARCEAGHGGRSAEDAAEEVQRQSAVRRMFDRHPSLPAAVHQEALRLLLTGYVMQLAKLMETFSFSITRFIHAASKLVSVAATHTNAVDSLARSNADNTKSDCALYLHEVFDGLHKELGLPRSFYAPHTAAATTAWSGWIVEQQTARAASLPGLLSATNPKVWTIAQSVLYATPQLRASVESLHRIFSGVFVYNLAFCMLLMRKSDLISLLLSTNTAPPSAPPSAAPETPLATESHEDVSPTELITVLNVLETLLAVPENSGYRPFLQDVFQSLPPSALRARMPTAAAVIGVASAASSVSNEN